LYHLGVFDHATNIVVASEVCERQGNVRPGPPVETTRRFGLGAATRVFERLFPTAAPHRRHPGETVRVRDPLELVVAAEIHVPPRELLVFVEARLVPEAAEGLGPARQQ